MTEVILIACSQQHADQTAFVKWGWTRINSRRWINHEGQEVHYVHFLEDVTGIKEAVVFMGYGAPRAPCCAYAENMIASGRWFAGNPMAGKRT
jgi:hypothetical protein